MPVPRIMSTTKAMGMMAARAGGGGRRSRWPRQRQVKLNPEAGHLCGASGAGRRGQIQSPLWFLQGKPNS